MDIASQLLLANKPSSGITDPYFDNVVLYVKGDGTNGSTNIIDSSNSNKTITRVGGLSISTAQSKYGGSSIYFDGADDYLSLSDSTDWTFSNNNLTIEAWLYAISGFIPLFSQLNFSSNLNRNMIGYWGVGGQIFSSSSVTIINVASDAFSFSSNTWNHYAITRSGNNFRFFLNGLQQGATIVNSNSFVDQSTPAYIGSNRLSDAQQYYNGYLDSFRITKGVARYTANFNPETDTYLAY